MKNAERRKPKREITCELYEAKPGERICRHFLKDGSCNLPEVFKCVEWLKMRGLPVPSPPRQRPKPAPQPTLIRTLSDEEIASFQALKASVRLSTEKGEVWLVPEYSKDSERKELRFDHAATLAVVCSVFPGAQVVELELGAVQGEQP